MRPSEVTAALLERAALADGESARACLYAILDGARDKRIATLRRTLGERVESLYDGEQGRDLAPFGPFLVELQPGSKAIGALVDAGWGLSWMVFLNTPSLFDELRRHLRRFLVVRMPDQRIAYFRYYDPRVLRSFLPSCTQEELQDFMGPIRAFLVESASGDELLEFAI
ncbi:DUF4123 domain-containing protein [Polyangium spumosum]|uniref:DUF4123 domain-containing protein n=1 Tax=Polyangium spumosum TaxID=889282 RepID=UPI00147866A7